VLPPAIPANSIKMINKGLLTFAGQKSGARFFSPTLRSNLLLRPGKWQENQSVIAGEAGSTAIELRN